jgi:hypothetical protein
MLHQRLIYQVRTLGLILALLLLSALLGMLSPEIAAQIGLVP